MARIANGGLTFDSKIITELLDLFGGELTPIISADGFDEAMLLFEDIKERLKYSKHSAFRFQRPRMDCMSMNLSCCKNLPGSADSNRLNRANEVERDQITNLTAASLFELCLRGNQSKDEVGPTSSKSDWGGDIAWQDSE